MALFSDPFDALAGLQQALESFRESSWLDAGLSGGGAYPPMNVFRKGDDFIIITELPGVKKSDLDVQVKGRTLRLSGEKAAFLPRERRGPSQGAARRPVRPGGDLAGRDQSGRRQGRISRWRPRALPAAGREREGQVHQDRMRATHEQGTEPKGRHHG